MQMRAALRKFLAGSLAVMLLLGLTACGKKEEARKINFQSAPAYTAEDIALPVSTGDLIGCCTDGEYMYILADEKTGDEVRSVLCRVSLADGTVTALADYQSSNAPEDAVVSRQGPALAPDGTLWLYEIWYVYHYDLPADFDEETEAKGKYLDSQGEFHHLRQLDPSTGQEKSLVDLSDAVRVLARDGSFDEPGVAVDGKGNVYFAWNDGVAVLDQNGNCLFTLEAELTYTMLASAGGRLVLLPDGTVAALAVLSSGNREVRTIDPEAKEWGEQSYTVPGSVDAVYNGRGECLFYYIQDGVLYGVVEGEIIPQRLLPLADTRIEGCSGTACFALLEENRAALLVRNMPNGGSLYEAEIRLVLLTPTDQLPEDGKIKIVYGAIGNQYYIKNRIEKFNRENDTYYIEFRDYTEGGYQTADTVEEHDAVRRAARLRLQAEVSAGKGPDILDSTLPLEIYASAGYLEDLWPWIDNDPEIDRAGLMTHVLECAETNGKLYTIGSSFTLRLCASAGNGEAEYDEVTPLLWESGPALCQVSLRGAGDLTAWDVYFGGPSALVSGNYEETLWDAGVLYTFVSQFNGEECTNYKNAPFVGAMEGVADGRLGYGTGAATGMPDREMYASFAGAPARDGAGSSFALQEQMSISAASGAKEGAWEFVRAMLLPGGYIRPDSFEGSDVSSAAGFPLIREEFEALVDPKWCRVDGDGEIILDKDGQPIEAPVDDWPIVIGDPAVMAAYQMAPTQAQIGRFWNLCNAIDHISRNDREMMLILQEQAQPYFAGDKSLDETADLIQRRVTLYVNENR